MVARKCHSSVSTASLGSSSSLPICDPPRVVLRAGSHSSAGWSAEIRIPLQSLTFDGSLDRWGFNVERRVERFQEVSRWASPFRDAKIAQTIRAGYITNLPTFDTGLGLTVRPALVVGAEKAGEEEDWKETFDPSLDVFQRLGNNATAMVTVNTDLESWS